MKYLNLYKGFLEKRSLESREKVTVANRICLFLKESKFKYEPGRDSNVFISFKTGDYETIIPSKSLGGSQYSSPQGFYCFDMNGFKQRLFGDDKIDPKNFNSANLSRSSDIINDLGLGYANNGNNVGSENIWNSSNGIPRYLYFVRIKPGSLILSSNSNSRKFYDPLKKLLRFYSHNFLKDNESKVFYPKDKVDIGNKSLREFKTYFEENKEKYKETFINRVFKLIKSIDTDEKELHILMYRFIDSCSYLINDDKTYLRFTLICKAIGIDGFTQREFDKSYIHPNPEYQTILLTESCVDELMKIDLKIDLKNDEYVTGEKSKLGLDSFIKSLNPGDILFDESNYSFYRFKDVEDFEFKFNKDSNTSRRFYPKDKKTTKKIELDKISKVDITKSEVWNFIKELKSGDYIKISSKLDDKTDESLFIKINKLEIENNTKINIDIKNRVIEEKVKWNGGTLIYINGERKNPDPDFEYDLKTPDKETPLFDPRKFNGSEYVYWLQNKEDLQKQGATWETIVDEYSCRDKVYKIDDLFNGESINMLILSGDLDLLNLLTSFKNEYKSRVFYYKRSNDYDKKQMTLFLYRGNLDKPLKILYSCRKF